MEYTDAFLALEDAGTQHIQDGDLDRLQSLLLESDPDAVSLFVPEAIVGAARAGDIRIMDWLVFKYPAALIKCGDDALDAAFEGEHTEAIVWITEAIAWLTEHGFTDPDSL